MRPSPFKIIGCGVLILALWAGVASSARAADGWWNEQWQYRKKIAFNTTPVGADISENLQDLPVLIRLHSGNFDFAHAKQDGSDLRFLNAADDTVLKHHIERFDLIDEIALVWVKLPSLAGNGDQQFIRMYYGNPNAAGGQDRKGSFDAHTVAVFHFDEVEGPPQDASAYKNHAAKLQGGQGLPAVIGTGITFAGAGDHLVIPAAPSLNFTDGFTFSTWIRIAGPMEKTPLFILEDEKRAFRVLVDGSKVCVEVQKGVTVRRPSDCVDLPVEQWHYLGVTAAPNKRVAIHLDGLEMTYFEIPEGIPVIEKDIYIGGRGDGERSFTGDLDEVRLSNTARSTDWLRAGFVSQGPEALMATFDIEEAGGGTGGLPVFYLKTIFENITLDGLVIIGLLALMALWSWIVFLGKTGFLWLSGRDNRAFQEAFAGASDPMVLPGDEEDYQGSNLYRIYAAGRQELNGTAASRNPGEVAGPSNLSAFKAALEKGFVRENQRLNGYLVVLTMAVSGGPFLGLLGTVWGVMNTFAAMAEAGEANIMAIAPGVASALSTTVVGLLVAIPALFSYNYLTSRIRNITADLTVFIDEFTVRVQAARGGGR